MNQELKIVLSDFQNVTKYADYTSFHVADESSGYRLTIGGYSGNAGSTKLFVKRLGTISGKVTLLFSVLLAFLIGINS